MLAVVRIISRIALFLGPPQTPPLHKKAGGVEEDEGVVDNDDFSSKSYEVSFVLWEDDDSCFDFGVHVGEDEVLFVSVGGVHVEAEGDVVVRGTDDDVVVIEEEEDEDDEDVVIEEEEKDVIGVETRMMCGLRCWRPRRTMFSAKFDRERRNIEEVSEILGANGGSGDSDSMDMFNMFIMLLLLLLFYFASFPLNTISCRVISHNLGQGKVKFYVLYNCSTSLMLVV